MRKVVRRRFCKQSPGECSGERKATSRRSEGDKGKDEGEVEVEVEVKEGSECKAFFIENSTVITLSNYYTETI